MLETGSLWVREQLMVGNSICEFVRNHMYKTSRGRMTLPKNHGDIITKDWSFGHFLKCARVLGDPFKDLYAVEHVGW